MPNPYLITLTIPSAGGASHTYDLRDAGARILIEDMMDLIKELMNFTEYLGVTTSAIDEGSTTNPILIGEESVTAEAGNVATRSSDNKEFIFSSTGIWQSFGNLSGLGALAFKDSASGAFTPAGTVSQPTFSGTAFTPAGTVSQPTFTGTAFTPAGTVSQPTFTGTEVTPAGTVSQPTFSGTAFTPAGTNSGTVLGTKTIKQFKTAGSMPTYTVSDGNLTISAGEVPTGEDVSVGDGSVTTEPTFTGTSVTPAGTVSQPTFSGTAFTPAGTVSQPTFSGTEVTPAGTVSQPTFSGTEVTPAGTVSQPTFSGTEGTVTVS